MNILASALDNIGAIDAGVVALVGYAVVFVGLIALMLVVMALGKYFVAQSKKTAAATAPVEEAPAPAAPAAVAPGSAGKLKLHDVEPKVAAMIMAITAEKLGKPLNELRFISIREVK